jgi:hypothetical protein
VEESRIFVDAEGESGFTVESGFRVAVSRGACFRALFCAALFGRVILGSPLKWWLPAGSAVDHLRPGT